MTGLPFDLFEAVYSQLWSFNLTFFRPSNLTLWQYVIGFTIASVVFHTSFPVPPPWCSTKPRVLACVRSRCQFYQHFTSSFFVRKCFAKLFSTHSLALYFFLVKEYLRKSCSQNVGEIDLQASEFAKKCAKSLIKGQFSFPSCFVWFTGKSFKCPNWVFLIDLYLVVRNGVFHWSPLAQSWHKPQVINKQFIAKPNLKHDFF